MLLLALSGTNVEEALGELEGRVDAAMRLERDEKEVG